MPTARYFDFLRDLLPGQKEILITGILLCMSACINAQSAKQYLKFGDEAMDKGECYSAAEYYKQGLKKYEFNLELMYKYAGALRGFNDYKNAAETYKKVTEQDVTKIYPLSYFWYGLMLHYLGRYEPAIKQFKKFEDNYKQQDYYRQKARQEIESCSWAAENTSDNAAITIKHLGKGVNTPYSETNPFEKPGGGFLFSSMRNVGDGRKKENFLARIYLADSAYTSSALFPVPVHEEEKHIANGAFSPDQKRFYFTVCEAPFEDASLLTCEIYMSRVNGDMLTAPQKLDTNINLLGSTSTQPNVGTDAEGNETLYFVSDRPGSIGKTDIWMSRINKDGSYQPPVNLGSEINSIDEEFSPFYDNAEHKLYFASDWHYSFGGLDIFESSYHDGHWSRPKNLGHAVNSPQNDFYFYKSFDRSKNYFASNRKGSIYIKSETCCNDIWMYETGTKTELPKAPDTTVTAVVTNINTTTSKAITETPGGTGATTDNTNTIKTTANTTADVHTDTAARVQTMTAKTDQPQRVWIDETIHKMKQRLPVTLYFHNDEPECCNLRDTTALNYVQTYQDYWRLLDKYRREFDKGLKGVKKTDADHAVFSLFTDRVEKGYHDLIQFSAQVLDILQAGQKLEITIQGYCSPLNYSEYNIKLGERRAASLRNYFFQYRDGILLPYISSGALTLRSESFGKEKAPATISDNREDKRNSVYNPAAALERKVEIISVELK